MVLSSPVSRLRIGDAHNGKEKARGGEARDWRLEQLFDALEEYQCWDEVPSSLRLELFEHAESASRQARAELGVGQGTSGIWEAPWVPPVRSRYRRLELTTPALDPEELRIERVLVGDRDVGIDVFADRLAVHNSRVNRWRDGEPAVGTPSAGEHTALRLERMRERLHQEGSVEALLDRRSLPAEIVLSAGHGRPHGRHGRRPPARLLLEAVVRAERERARVFREAAWAAMRIQGQTVREIAASAGVAPSTVSETPAVRLAGSLMETALLMLAGEGTKKSELAAELRIDIQRVQRAARAVEEVDTPEPVPPPDADLVDRRPWDLREHSRGLLNMGLPTMVELAAGMERDRAEALGKLLQLAGDDGKAPTMAFRQEPPHVQPWPRSP